KVQHHSSIQPYKDRQLIKACNSTHSNLSFLIQT
ncbi:hypothetical protein Leryth_019593, partial [Lithospermum erythrorhizon]